MWFTKLLAVFLRDWWLKTGRLCAGIFFMEDTRSTVLNTFSVHSIKVCKGLFTQEISLKYLKYFVIVVKSGGIFILCSSSRNADPTISPYKCCIWYAKTWYLFFPAVSADWLAQDLKSSSERDNNEERWDIKSDKILDM